MEGLVLASQDAGWIPGDDGSAGNVTKHHAACAHDRIRTDAHPRQDNRPCTDKRSRLDLHLTGQMRAGADVNAFSERALVIDAGRSVHDATRADAGAGRKGTHCEYL